MRPWANPKPSAPSVAHAIREWKRLVAEGRPEEAAKLCRKTLKRFPNDVALLLVTSAVTSDDEEKQRLARRAVRLAPEDPEALTMAATSMFHSQQLDEASQYLSRAAALVPAGWEHEADLLHLGGRIAAIREDNARAEAMLRAAFEAQPEEPHHGAAYAEILAILGRYTEALAIANSSLRHFPDDEWLHRLRRDLLEVIAQQGG